MRLFLLLSLVGLACGAEGPPAANAPAPPAPDAGMPEPASDAGMPEPASDAGMPEPAATCGADRLETSGAHADGPLVVARDGTLYYANGVSIGRLRPGGPADNRWVALPASGGAFRVEALVLTADTLYASTGREVDSIDTTAGQTSLADVTTTFGARGMRGATVGSDGAIYFVAGDASVWRWSGGRLTLVSRGPAANVAFSPDGGLHIVTPYPDDGVVRLTLHPASHAEIGRTQVVSRPPMILLRSLAFDRDGRMYLTGRLNGMVRYPRDGGAAAIRSGPGLMGYLAFGTGVLRCDDLYVGASQTVERVAIEPWR